MWLQAIANGALVGMSIAWLWNFAQLGQTGTLIITEPHRAILAAEIILVAICLVLGLLAFMQVLIKGRGKRR